MAKKKTQKTLSKGIFTKFKTGLLYLNGTIDGKTYKDVATGLKYTKANLAYLKKHKDAILREKAGLKIKNDSPTLVEYGLKVIEQGAKQINSLGLVGKRGRNPQNQKDITDKWNNHVKPFFLNTKISSIDVSDINDWQNQLKNKKTGKSLSGQTANAIRQILKEVFHQAVGDNLVSKNVVEYSRAIEVHHQDKGFYSPDEIASILQTTKGSMRVMLELVSKYGLRIAETNGIMLDTSETVGDIEIKNGVLYLQRSLNDKHTVSTTKDDPNLKYLVKKFDPNNQKKVLAYIASTKNHKRAIVLSTKTIELLKKYISTLPKNQKFLFVTKFKEPYSGSKNILHKLKKITDKLGIENRGLHKFRHSMVTMSISEGINPSATVGHSNSATTEIYNHNLLTQSVISAKRADVEKIEALLKKGE